MSTSNFSSIKWHTQIPQKPSEIKGFDEKTLKSVYAFHRSFPEYNETPLISLDDLASRLGVKAVLLKDESKRFGLNAFKALGGSYAIGKYISKYHYLLENEIPIEQIRNDAQLGAFKNITFVTATDGNHGNGVAWAAAQLGSKSIVYMPKGSAIERVRAIEKHGAKVIVTDMNYDDAVRLASEVADKNGYCLIQDTAWEGYEIIPLWISQGYATLAKEAYAQMQEINYSHPTHLFLQAGVGSFAGSILSYFINNLKENYPHTTIIEANAADCLYKSIVKNDGLPHAVAGNLDTIMAGLACGEPSINTWPVLRDYASIFASCPDYVAAEGMRYLAEFKDKNENPVISGESGAVGIGLLLMALRPELSKLKEALMLTSDSVILCISTEGDTDKINYHEIISSKRYQVPF